MEVAAPPALTDAAREAQVLDSTAIGQCVLDSIRRGAPFVRGADPLGAFGRRARRREVGLAWTRSWNRRSRSRRRAAAALDRIAASY